MMPSTSSSCFCTRETCRVALNKILTANFFSFWADAWDFFSDVKTRPFYMTHSDGDLSPSCYIYRYLQSFPNIWIHAWTFCANDRWMSTHTTCAHPVRIREEYTSDKIPELHFVWNCNFAGFTYGSYLLSILLSTPTPSFLPSLSGYLSTSGNARRILYQRECA